MPALDISSPAIWSGGLICFMNLLLRYGEARAVDAARAVGPCFGQ
ncbi:hypothetical protein OG558_33105 [Kribbella sp. NBC_01510]